MLTLNYFHPFFLFSASTLFCYGTSSNFFFFFYTFFEFLMFYFRSSVLIFYFCFEPNARPAFCYLIPILPPFYVTLKKGINSYACFPRFFQFTLILSPLNNSGPFLDKFCDRLPLRFLFVSSSFYPPTFLMQTLQFFQFVFSTSVARFVTFKMEMKEIKSEANYCSLTQKLFNRRVVRK